MNYTLLVGVAIVFVFQLSLGRSVEPIIREFAFVPDAFRAALADGRLEVIADAASRIFTSMFLHGSWFHVIGNLLYLRVFGDNIEDRFGHILFFLFYLASGAAGALGQYLFDANDHLPMIGASGAIAGVLGAYIVLFPAAKIVTLFPIFIVLTFIEVPAIFFLGIWALQQLLNGYLALGGVPETSGVAWFAHLGGFVLGIFCGALWRLTHRRAKTPPEAPVT